MQINWESLTNRFKLVPEGLLTPTEVHALLQALGLEPNQAIVTANNEHQRLLAQAENLHSNAAAKEAEARSEYEAVVAAAKQALADRLQKVGQMRRTAKEVQAQAVTLGTALNKLQ